MMTSEELEAIEDFAEDLEELPHLEKIPVAVENIMRLLAHIVELRQCIRRLMGEP